MSVCWMHKLSKVCVCLGGGVGGDFEVPPLGHGGKHRPIFVLWAISLILSTSPTRKVTKMSPGEWRHMEINLHYWGLVFELRSVHPKAWTLFTPGWWRLSLIAFSQPMIYTVPSWQDAKLSNALASHFREEAPKLKLFPPTSWYTKSILSSFLKETLELRDRVEQRDDYWNWIIGCISSISCNWIWSCVNQDAFLSFSSFNRETGICTIACTFTTRMILSQGLS